jgi:hypothetical protein
VRQKQTERVREKQKRDVQETLAQRRKVKKAGEEKKKM